MSKLKKIVEEVVKEECVEEAMKILSLSSEEEVEEFIKYCKEDKHNVCCLHLDFLKIALVKNGKMEEGGHFGYQI